MKFRHLLLALPVLCAGNAFSQINNQISSAQSSANAWISGTFRANTGFEINAAPGTGGYLFYNSTLTTGDISGKLRWIIRGQEAEAGSNSGYDLAFIRRNDAGVAIDAPLTLVRATGGVNMPGVVNMGQNSSVAENFKIKGSATGVTNISGIGIYDSDNTTRKGYLGDASSANNDMYVISDLGDINLNAANGNININGNTSNMLVYKNVGINVPSFNTRSSGTKVVWNPANTPSNQVDFATGIESLNVWNSVPGNSATYGFKWYGGITQIARMDGLGNFETNGILKLGLSGAERLSAKNNAIGFNRDVNANANFTSAGHAYQFNHVASATAGSDKLDLAVYNTVGALVSANAFSINGAGNIGMGIAPQSGYKLAVDGTMSARKVKVTQETWADYVFQSGYKLPTIAETEAFINENKHLPGIPSAKEVRKEGIDVGEMNKLLLQKIEEQMLYIIEMNKEMKALKEAVKELKKKG